MIIFSGQGGTNLLPVLAKNWSQANSGAAKFKIDSFLSSGANNLATWGGLLLLILGVAGIIVAAYKVITGMMSHGRKEVNWILYIALFVVSALFIFGGWGVVVQTIGAGAQQTVQEWGSVVLPLLFT